ncbi:histidine phosphatase superfamily [Aspergillus cavernicola]|uniref:Histidine phosphatase superfamily n=1 Tax=Aspergillus cavernicola TaxID=176166 RepID=A0ABR4HST9_9EURO
MPAIIHCVRHAQGVHNLCTANHVILDPLLTDLGNEQCTKLRDAFPRHDKIDLIVASPLRRTIYTALQSFEPVFKANPNLKLILLPDIQETSDVPCDTGSDTEALKKEIAEKGLPVDTSLVEEGWNVKTGRYAPTNAAVSQRARTARRWLKARPEKEIVMVSHGSLLHYFTDDWEDSSQFQGTGWVNAQYRTYTFSENIDMEDLAGHKLDGDNATLIETIESRQGRGKEGPMGDREKQKELYKKGVQGWSDQGLQLSTAEREAAKVPAGKEVNGVRV